MMPAIKLKTHPVLLQRLANDEPLPEGWFIEPMNDGEKRAALALVKLWEQSEDPIIVKRERSRSTLQLLLWSFPLIASNVHS